MDFTFKGSHIGRSRAPFAESAYYFVPAGAVGRLVIDDKDEHGQDAPAAVDWWPTAVPQDGAPAGDPRRVLGPAPAGVVFVIEVSAYRIRADRRIASDAETVELVVNEGLVQPSGLAAKPAAAPSGAPPEPIGRRS